MARDGAVQCAQMHFGDRQGLVRAHAPEALFITALPRCPPYWQASQSGLSIEQNLMSVAGSAAMAGSAATGACGAAAWKPPPTLLDTALSWPRETVDFSACVAPMVRR